MTEIRASAVRRFDQLFTGHVLKMISYPMSTYVVLTGDTMKLKQKISI